MRIFCLRERDGLITPLEPAGAAPWAELVPGNPLDPENFALPPHPRAPLLVAWSGTLADDLFGDDPRTWGPRGWESFNFVCNRLAPELTARRLTLLFRPHARHVLSDAPSCARFIRERAPEDPTAPPPFGLLLDPVSMLTASMLPTAEDHLTRLLDALAPSTAVAAVIASNIAPSPPASPANLPTAAPLHAGALDPARLHALFAPRVGDRLPIVILEAAGDLAAQVAVLQH